MWCHLHIWDCWYFYRQSWFHLLCFRMYSAYKLNKQGDNIQPWHTPFPIWNQSVVPCPVLTVASWPAHRFLRRQFRWSGIPIPSHWPATSYTSSGLSLNFQQAFSKPPRLGQGSQLQWLLCVRIASLLGISTWTVSICKAGIVSYPPLCPVSALAQSSHSTDTGRMNEGIVLHTKVLVVLAPHTETAGPGK